MSYGGRLPAGAGAAAPLVGWIAICDPGPVRQTGRVGFTEVDLLTLAGQAVYARGEEYVRHVHGLVVTGSSAQASIRAKRVYWVELSWADGGDGIGGSCTCPHHAEGNFCKHLVAVGLAVLSGAPSPPSQPEVDALSRYVDRLDRDELAALVLGLARDHEPVRRALQTAAVRAGEPAVDSRELIEHVNETLRVGFVDYRRSFDLAAEVQQLLDELEQLLDAGAADGVRPALERAVTRLRTVSEHADDSAGVLGDACQRAADLHARACREGAPDPVRLARWLAKFRLETPGWPQTPLANYVGALDLDVYRRAVARAPDDFETRQMRLELLDHDGDVDGAIALLCDGEHPQYGAIISRLAGAGRVDEALQWLDRAVAAGRIWHADDEYHRSYDTATQMYQRAGRLEDALAVRRDAFARNAGWASFARLLDAARLVDRAEAERTERTWALTEAERQAAQPYGDAAALIEIALHEDDPHLAMRTAERYGAGDMWQRLADACATTMPAASAQLYQGQIAELLREANSRNYATAVRYLVKLRELFVAMDQLPAFEVYLDRVRDANKRRPTFMAALDRRLR